MDDDTTLLVSSLERIDVLLVILETLLELVLGIEEISLTEVVLVVDVVEAIDEES
jgi:hypothetical protein